jgi:hypothetical protein
MKSCKHYDRAEVNIIADGFTPPLLFCQSCRKYITKDGEVMGLRDMIEVLPTILTMLQPRGQKAEMTEVVRVSDLMAFVETVGKQLE